MLWQLNTIKKDIKVIKVPYKRLRINHLKNNIFDNLLKLIMT